MNRIVEMLNKSMKVESSCELWSERHTHGRKAL